MIEGCILCANGNDLPEGERCEGCGREGLAFGLRAAVIKARGRHVPPRTPVAFDSNGAQLAYNTFRGGCRADRAPPHWENLEPWMRDAMLVAYLQGTLHSTSLTTGQGASE